MEGLLCVCGFQMDNRKRPAGSSHCGSVAIWSSIFPRQPARVLIVEALPPWWSDTCTVLCDALDNVLSLACNLDGPCRIPLLSIYAISRQQECLLPFVQVRGNLARLHSCVEELRSIPGDGCVRGSARGDELLRQAVLDSLQQFKQYVRHISSGNQNNTNISVEATVMTSQHGQGVVRQLEMGLKDADLVSLKRLLVVQICSSADWGKDVPPPEATPSETDDSFMMGVEIDLQQVDNSVFTMEMLLKAWLQEQGGDREHLHLQLPGSLNPVCIKCDMQERLISPALIPMSPNIGMKTENMHDFLPTARGSANQSLTPQRLKAIKSLRADGLCESVLYGLPLVIRPTTCWRLDWDEVETNLNLFQALCHTLRSCDLFLLLQSEPSQRAAAGGSGVYSHYVLQPSSSFSLLLKPVASRELLLPCPLPASTQDPTAEATQTIQACLSQLDEEFGFNPLFLNGHLYQHLRSRGLVSQPRYPYRLQPAVTKGPPPLGGTKATVSRQPRQLQNHGHQVVASSKVRATVAPLPSSSSMGPPPAKASRPALTLLSSSRTAGHRAPIPTFFNQLGKEEEDEDGHTVRKLEGERENV